VSKVLDAVALLEVVAEDARLAALHFAVLCRRATQEVVQFHGLDSSSARLILGHTQTSKRLE